jgi:hypothetical protein
MKTRRLFFIIMLIIGAVIFMYLIKQNQAYQSTLKEIKFVDDVHLEVKDAYNERGIYILNDMYFVSSATYIIGKSTIPIKDDAVWRPSGYKHIPRISDIKAPFLMTKSKNNDTVFIVKDEHKFFLLLKGE